MTNDILKALDAQGQSIWLDNLTRDMIRGGRLAGLIRAGVTGVTSNPAIFHKAISAGEGYDADIRSLAEGGADATAIYEGLAIRDIQDACDLFRPVHEASNGTDGYVSLEVSPHLARNTQGTIDEARRLWAAVGRENVLIKIPGTPEGIPAIQTCLTEGIHVNITLLFSLEAYGAVMEAHLAAMEARMARGLDLANVASVASFFLSRIDSAVDAKLDALGTSAATALKGTAAVASAKLAYRAWSAVYSGERWEKLKAAGARVQKPLWASTSTKDPSYPDLKYVEPLIGPFTVNTLPDETLDALLDHGTVAKTVADQVDQAREALTALAGVGIALEAVTDDLVREGIEKFVAPFDTLLAGIDARRRTVAS